MLALSSSPASFLSIRGRLLNIEFDQNISVGERLRTARERAKLSIEMVADQSRLSRRYIVAIEQDRLDLLPGDIYVINFCRIYAKYLGINDKEISFMDKNIRKNLKKYLIKNIENEYLSQQNDNNMRVMLGFIILIIMSIVFLLNLYNII